MGNWPHDPERHLSENAIATRAHASKRTPLRMLSDLQSDIPVSDRELTLLALLLGDRLTAILEDNS